MADQNTSHFTFRRGVERLLAPAEHFLKIEAASGIVLMIAALMALAFANSPWRVGYSQLWHIPIAFRFGDFAFERDLHFWINDGLMTIFFFVVGLEIRREIYSGVLSELRQASLPIAAAFGGMKVPALLFLALNLGRPSETGWAVPMATDIAFAVGALALLGRRVAPALRILLLAIAVIDDVGAITVIALFYSTGVALSGFAVMVLGIVAILSMRLVRVRSMLTYVAPGLVVWSGALMAGIHPTLAGVILGLMTPVRAGNEAASPVQRLQHALHGWVAFGIMPLFAFANAGLEIGNVQIAADAGWAFAGVTLGLIIGKPIGILAFSWLAVRLRISTLPSEVRWSHLGVIGLVSGIGFTMALFIAELAFAPGSMLDAAKLGILCGSAMACIVAVIVGYRILTPVDSRDSI